jgi:hypothetical protein
MYQLEVKRWLVAYFFPVAEGWHVTVDIDSWSAERRATTHPRKRPSQRRKLS